MNRRVKVDELGKPGLEEKKPEPISPPDERSEVPPGDPMKETATVSKTQFQSVDIATPTARKLFETKAVFPFDLFQDQLIIDEVKVSIVSNQFFGTRSISHILIKDIKHVEVNTVPIFGEFLVEGPEGKIKIDFLWKDKAYQARRIILGLMIMGERMVDTSKMEVPELINRVEELGKARK